MQFGWEKALGDDDELAWWVDRARGHGAPVSDGRTLADAYTATGGAWQAGPGRIYDQLSQVLVDHCPGGVAGRAVLDLGAGTGAASRAAQSAGARTTIAVDVAVGMLRHERDPSATGRGR